MRLNLFLVLLSACFLRAEPPFSGTIFLDPDIILPSDPTTYVGLEYTGQADRVMFDRRPAAFVTYNAFLFNASYLGGQMIEMQVNPEFETEDAAREQALKFAPVIGRLPRSLLRDVETVWIHKGNNLFGGGNKNLLIHTGQADDYIREGILEETLVHEASHTSLDADHASTEGWLAAQVKDPEFITTYARDNPTREDIAETFLVWLAVRYRADRISESLKETIEESVPNRLAYFDEQDFDLFPMVIPEKALRLENFRLDLDTMNFELSCASRFASFYDLEASTDLEDWTVLKGDILSEGEMTKTTEELPENTGRIFFRVLEKSEG